jgi:hypothetical protein
MRCIGALQDPRPPVRLRASWRCECSVFRKKISILPAPAIHSRFGQATNVKGEVLIAIYETHTEAAIELPFPQYEVRLKTGPRPEVQADLLRPARGAASSARGVGPAGG